MIATNLRALDDLPQELKPEDRAGNLKKIIKIYGKTCDENDVLSKDYGELLDIETAKGQEIDLIGAMLTIFRNDHEEDEDFKTRILATIINRKTPTTIPEIQQAIESVIGEGKLYVFENHTGKPANIYITGTANSDEVDKAFALIRGLLPAGIRLVIPVVSFETWGHVRDQFPTWESIGQDGYIW